MSKYETEETLIEKVQTGEYGMKEYFRKYSRETAQAYETFCRAEGLDPDREESAIRFAEEGETEFEYALEKGDA